MQNAVSLIETSKRDGGFRDTEAPAAVLLVINVDLSLSKALLVLHVLFSPIQLARLFRN